MPEDQPENLAFDPQTVADRTLGIGSPGIDRRTCRRVVPLRVLCLGPSRTGTTSLREALITLGYKDCYHYGSLYIENPRDAEMWNEAWDACFDGKGSFTRGDWDQLLGHCQAVTDVPSFLFYRQLLEAYPEAKVVLTVRDSPEDWHRSILNTVLPLYQKYYLPPKTWWLRIYRLFQPPWSARSSFEQRMADGCRMYIDLDRDEKNGTRRAIAWLEGYHHDLKALVPSDRLLVYNVKEGWEPLCKFLGEDIPDMDFPKMNTTQEWDIFTAPAYALMDRYVYTNMAKKFGVVVVAAAAVIASRYLRS